MRLSAAISGRFVRFLCIGLGKPKTEGPAVKLALGVEMSLLPALSAGGGGAGSTHSLFGTHRATFPSNLVRVKPLKTGFVVDRKSSLLIPP